VFATRFSSVVIARGGLVFHETRRVRARPRPEQVEERPASEVGTWGEGLGNRRHDAPAHRRSGRRQPPRMPAGGRRRWGCPMAMRVRPGRSGRVPGLRGCGAGAPARVGRGGAGRVLLFAEASNHFCSFVFVRSPSEIQPGRPAVQPSGLRFTVFGVRRQMGNQRGYKTMPRIRETIELLLPGPGDDDVRSSG
jgi:hypothetical protein